MLAYKAIRLGVEMKEVNESWSTVTCSSCGSRSDPRGLRHLAVREWVCSCCGASHLRDVNVAKNILQFSLSGMTGQLWESPRGGCQDLLSTKLAMPEDLEESALTINGKKNRLKRTDFDELATKLGIPAKSTKRVYAKFLKKQTAMIELIGTSFLPDEMKQEYTSLLLKNLDSLK